MIPWYKNEDEGVGHRQSRIQLSIRKSFRITGLAAPPETSNSREKGSKLKIALPASTTFFLGITAGSRCFLPEILWSFYMMPWFSTLSVC